MLVRRYEAKTPTGIISYLKLMLFELKISYINILFILFTSY